MTHIRKLAFGAGGLALVTAMTGLPAGTAAAQELRIGLASETTSMDPHFHNLGPNNQVRRHIFESLITQDENMALIPALATEWEALDDTTWQFTLREGVSFHDGTPFTARDVIYTVCRIPHVENSPSSFRTYTAAIADMEAVDDHTLIIRTDEPYPLLPTELSTWGIISADLWGAEELTFDREDCGGMGTLPQAPDFDAPETVVGTGPFRFASWQRGDRLVLERNDDYWGRVVDFERVVLRPITSSGPRVAALLAGDVDMIASPPVQDVDRIRNEGFEIVEALSNRVLFLAMDFQEGSVPGIRGTDGENPLRDARVREAISTAINREAIVERIHGGLAEPAGELLAPPMFGTSGRAVDPYDPERARELLAEAGYPDGFQMTLAGMNDRYANDADTAQAMAQMLTVVGIQTDLDVMSNSQFWGRRNRNEFSIWFAGWGSATAEVSSPLVALAATQNPELGHGASNAGKHSNPELDELIIEAMTTIDVDTREELLVRAQQLALETYAVIPVLYPVLNWAYRPGLQYTPRTDEDTLAYEVRLVE